jgi:PAS domain-containing protein
MNEAPPEFGTSWGCLPPSPLRSEGYSHPQLVNDCSPALSLWTCEYRYQHPNGQTLWIHGKASPERSEDGSVLKHGFITDITNRKRHEALLERQEARFRLLVDSIADHAV